jgi:hypothetical protein
MYSVNHRIGYSIKSHLLSILPDCKTFNTFIEIFLEKTTVYTIKWHLRKGVKYYQSIIDHSYNNNLRTLEVICSWYIRYYYRQTNYVFIFVRHPRDNFLDACKLDTISFISAWVITIIIYCSIIKKIGKRMNELLYKYFFFLKYQQGL